MRRYRSWVLSFLRATLTVCGVVAVAAVPGFGAPTAEAATSNVKIVDNNYDPTTVNINVGDTVSWMNTGKVEHTVTSEAGIFDSKRIAAGGRYDLVFNSPGTYYYYCTIHPREMRGKVVVGNGQPQYGTGTAMMGGGYGGGAMGYGGYGGSMGYGGYGGSMGYGGYGGSMGYGGYGYGGCCGGYGYRSPYHGYGYAFPYYGYRGYPCFFRYR